MGLQGRARGPHSQSKRQPVKVWLETVRLTGRMGARAGEECGVACREGVRTFSHTLLPNLQN